MNEYNSVKLNNIKSVNTTVRMPQNPEVINGLRRLGLNQYEAKAYFALSTTGKNTAGKLSEHAELPRARSYDVLGSLQDKGFVAVQPGRPVKYYALPLGEAIKTLKRQRQETLSQELTRIDQLSGDLSSKLDLSFGVSKPSFEDAVWTLKGREAIYSKLAAMIDSAKKHVIISSSSEGMQRKLAEHRKLLERARGRGVKIHLLSTLSKEKLGDMVKIAKTTSTELPTRMVLADDQALLFLTDHSSSPEDEVALWLNSGHVVDTLKQAVE